MKNCNSSKRSISPPVVTINSNSGYATNIFQVLSSPPSLPTFNQTNCGFCYGTKYMTSRCSPIRAFVILSIEFHKASNNAKNFLRRPHHNTNRETGFKHYLYERFDSTQLKPLFLDQKIEMSWTAMRPSYLRNKSTERPRARSLGKEARSLPVHSAIATNQDLLQ